MIGGTAAALHYGVTRATHDIDTWTTVQGDLAAAAERARVSTDLVLMKAMRGYEHDLQAIAEIHAHSPLDLDELIGRFQDEMTPIGDPPSRTITRASREPACV